MDKKAPKLKVKTVFIDVDDTITGSKSITINENDPDLYPIVALLMRKYNLPLDEAKAVVEKAERGVGKMVGRYWPFGILNQLGLTESELWETLVNSARGRLFIYPDAVFLLKALKKFSDICVYTATTNPRLVILSKLALANLADRSGSPYLDGCFGGEEVSIGGKCGPQFYLALLERTGSNPKETLMLGDDPKTDLIFAKEAGVKQVILPRREQSKDWIYEDDGGTYVKSLQLVVELLGD